MSEESVEHHVAGILGRRDGRILLIRRAGSDIYSQLGGPLMEGKTAISCLRQYINEALSLNIDNASFSSIGLFTCSSNDFSAQARFHVFYIPIDQDVAPAGHPHELIWVQSYAAKHLSVTPLLQSHIMPLDGLCRHLGVA